MLILAHVGLVSSLERAPGFGCIVVYVSRAVQDRLLVLGVLPMVML